MTSLWCSQRGSVSWALCVISAWREGSYLSDLQGDRCCWSLVILPVTFVDIIFWTEDSWLSFMMVLSSAAAKVSSFHICCMSAALRQAERSQKDTNSHDIPFYWKQKKTDSGERVTWKEGGRGQSWSLRPDELLLLLELEELLEDELVCRELEDGEEKHYDPELLNRQVLIGPELLRSEEHTPRNCLSS